VARTADAARRAAAAPADRELASSNCASTSVEVDASGFAAPIGTDASVSVVVRCTFAMGDLAAPGVPGTKIVTGHATSPIDRYRSR
jgi:hypothetical protein